MVIRSLDFTLESSIIMLIRPSFFLFQVIKSDDPDDETFIVELYPIQLHLYRHAAAQRHVVFSFQSLGLSHFPFQSQSQSQPQAQLPSPPRRTHMYYGCFSKKNTLKQVRNSLEWSFDN